MFISSFFLFFIILFTSQDIICHLEHSFCFPSCSIFTDIHLFIYLRLIINCINKQIILNLSFQEHQNALEDFFFVSVSHHLVHLYTNKSSETFHLYQKHTLEHPSFSLSLLFHHPLRIEVQYIYELYIHISDY